MKFRTNIYNTEKTFSHYTFAVVAATVVIGCVLIAGTTTKSYPYDMVVDCGNGVTIVAEQDIVLDDLHILTPAELKNHCD